MSDGSQAGLGHNNPPEETQMDPLAIIRERSAPMVVTALVNAIFGAPRIVDSAEGLEEAAKFVKASRADWKELNDLRDACKRPYDELSKGVQSHFLPALDALANSSKSVLVLVGQHNDRVAEAERKAAAEAAAAAKEEAERRLTVADSLLEAGLEDAADGVAATGEKMLATAEKLSQQASGSTADLARHRTSYGTTTSRVEWSHKIDYPELRKTLGKLKDHIAATDLDKAVRAFRVAEVKAGREPVLRGVTFTKGTIGAVR